MKIHFSKLEYECTFCELTKPISRKFLFTPLEGPIYLSNLNEESYLKEEEDFRFVMSPHSHLCEICKNHIEVQSYLLEAYEYRHE